MARATLAAAKKRERKQQAQAYFKKLQRRFYALRDTKTTSVADALRNVLWSDKATRHALFAAEPPHAPGTDQQGNLHCQDLPDFEEDQELLWYEDHGFGVSGTVPSFLKPMERELSKAADEYGDWTGHEDVPLRRLLAEATPADASLNDARGLVATRAAAVIRTQAEYAKAYQELQNAVDHVLAPKMSALIERHHKAQDEKEAKEADAEPPHAPLTNV